MKHTHAATLEPGGSGGYNVRVSDLPGCNSHWEDLFDRLPWERMQCPYGSPLQKSRTKTFRLQTRRMQLRWMLPHSIRSCAGTDAYRLAYLPGAGEKTRAAVKHNNNLTGCTLVFFVPLGRCSRIWTAGGAHNAEGNALTLWRSVTAIHPENHMCQMQWSIRLVLSDCVC